MSSNYSISEQIPNDGGYHLPRLVKEANDRLSKIGKHGKRAKIKVTAKPNKPISAQFSLPSKGQIQYGLDLPLTINNLVKAEEYCTLITSQLVAGTFTDDWLDKLIGKEVKTVEDEEQALTCKEMLDIYKVHYFKERKDEKTVNVNWYINYRHLEKVLSNYSDRPISLKIVRKIIDCTENNSDNRARTLNGLANILSHFDNDEFKSVIKKYKLDNKPKRQNKHVPDDGEIIDIYNFGFEIHPKSPKKYRYRNAQWQFLYAILATYGLRIHEAWHIKNWNNPVHLKDGDWIAVSDETQDIENEDDEAKYVWQRFKGNSLTIPAILDPDNKTHLLAIGHETKTGYRIAFPLSPSGCNWIEQFNIVQPFNIPDVKNSLKSNNEISGVSRLTIATDQWFRKRKYGFTPHALRHAYNIRGHKLGVNQKVLCDSLGHGLQMNSTTYLRHESDNSKLAGILQEVSKDKQKRSEIELLKQENKELKLEVERLKAELTMYRAIKMTN